MTYKFEIQKKNTTNRQSESDIKKEKKNANKTKMHFSQKLATNLMNRLIDRQLEHITNNGFKNNSLTSKISEDFVDLK